MIRIPLDPLINNCPEIFKNFCLYVFSETNMASHYGALPPIEENLKKELCHVKIIQIFDHPTSLSKWYLEFETEEDYITFTLRWS